MNQRILAVMSFVLLGTSGALFAMEGAPNAAELDRHKQAMVANIDTRIANLQTLKACVTAATSQEALRQCHQAEAARNMDMRSQEMGRRKQEIDQKMQRLQEEKTRLGQQAPPPTH